MRVFITTGAGLTLAACHSEKPIDPARTLVQLDTTRGADSAFVVIRGLARDQLKAWQARPATDPAWSRTFRIFATGNMTAPVAARYVANDTFIKVIPKTPLDRGQKYDVLITPLTVEGETQKPGRTTTIGLPATKTGAITQVMRVIPDLATLPENLLRLYIEFTGPMSREGGLSHVHLREVGGDSVRNAFLVVAGGDFWNADRTRYTLFIDPGHAKRGSAPSAPDAHPLVAGRNYELKIDSLWRDANGQFLGKAFVKGFRVEAAQLGPITLAEWKVIAPRANTRDPLIVQFPRPLDYGLLKRALGVETSAGVAIAGVSLADPSLREWRLIPAAPWSAGAHQLTILPVLADLAGNRVNLAFDAGGFSLADTTSTAPPSTVPFVIR